MALAVGPVPHYRIVTLSHYHINRTFAYIWNIIQVVINWS